MILRLAANAAVHTVGGLVMGVTGVLAACTLALTAARGLKHPAPPSRADMPKSSGANDGSA
jgi:hypothetical protein